MAGDLIEALRRQRASGDALAVARVVATFGSAPREVGATMTVDRQGAVVGSISGGCVEGAVYQMAEEALTTGTSSLHRFGVTDDDAFHVGLTCGGEIEVFVEVWDSHAQALVHDLIEAVDSGAEIALATVIAHPEKTRIGQHVLVRPGASGKTLGDALLDDLVRRDALDILMERSAQAVHYDLAGDEGPRGVSIFVQPFVPRRRMIVFGAVEFGAALATAGAFLGFRVTVCDAREVFATRERLPAADEVVVQWPHQYLEDEIVAGRLGPSSVVCVLTHDPKFDTPLLTRLLDLPDGVRPGYIGAMGSRHTDAERRAALRMAGISTEQLQSLRSPIGLDLGARTPAETAVSIVSEIIATRGDRSGAPLSRTSHALHGGASRLVRSPARCAPERGARDETA